MQPDGRLDYGNCARGQFKSKTDITIKEGYSVKFGILITIEIDDKQRRHNQNNGN